MVIHGKCHCGNIALELQWNGDPAAMPARACGCSFCVKHGGVWTSQPDAKLAITIEHPELVSKYTFATATATFVICSRCGVVPVVTSEIDGHVYAVVNVNALENVDRSALQPAPADFDGENVNSRLARRKRNWIAAVELAARDRALR